MDDFSEQGKRVCSIGVPPTFPPKEVNGVLISGFLPPSLKGATYPPYLEKELEQAGYVIGLVAWQALVDRESFLDELFNAFDRRCETMFRFLGQEPWDLFVAHIMDTDRLHHFMWSYYEEDNETFAPWFCRFYDRVDRMIGNLVDRIHRDVYLSVREGHTTVLSIQAGNMNHFEKKLQRGC